MDPDYDLVINTFTGIWPRYEELGFEGLTGPEQVIFCTWQFVCEVNNGGFHQYFRNPSGTFAAETSAALKRVQMPHASSLLQQALAAFPNNTAARDNDCRQREIRSLPQSVQHNLFDDLTSSFIDSAENPYRLQAVYIDHNTNKFVGSSGN